MALVPAINPFTATAPLVDKMIGDAYDVVKEVYDNMELVQAVGSSIAQSTIGEPLLVQRALTQTGITHANVNGSVTVELPDLAMDHKLILASHVAIEGASGKMYFADSGQFTATVDTNGLTLVMSATALADARSAAFTWFIIYGAPAD